MLLVTVTSGPYQRQSLSSLPGTPISPHHLSYVSSFLLLKMLITPADHPNPLTSSHILCAPPPVSFKALPLVFPEPPTRRGRRVKDREPAPEGAGPRPRSLFMNGGAGGARPHYYAAQQALRSSARRPLACWASDVTEPVAGGGAGRGDSRRVSRGRGGFSGSAHTLLCQNLSGGSPRPGRTRS